VTLVGFAGQSHMISHDLSHPANPDRKHPRYIVLAIEVTGLGVVSMRQPKSRKHLTGVVADPVYLPIR
jgi:hypothetical protein